MSRSNEDALASMGAGLVFLGMVLAIWLLVKASEMIVRVFVKHPRNKALWAALGIALVACSAVLVNGAADAVLDGVAALSLVGFLVTAKAVQLYYEPLLLQEMNREVLVDEVLHQAWWSPS